MIGRYADPKLQNIFSEERKFALFLQVECAVIAAREEKGLVPKGTAKRILGKVRLSPKAIEKIEQTLHHDVLSFVRHVNLQIGADARFFHAGLTSYDIVDTALALRLQEGCRILEKRVQQLLSLLKRLGKRHAKTPMMGRTHGMFAEPIAFGQKLALFYSNFSLHLSHLKLARREIAVGKLSGAVGNYAHFSPELERAALRKLGLTVVPVASQVVPRERHAYLLMTLAAIASSCDQMAQEVRLLQRSEVEELEEPFAAGQRGSSAMPHKRNPHRCERVSSLARLLRSYALVSLENIPLWHERDLTNSANERFLFSESFLLLDAMLRELLAIYRGLTVKQENMARNIARSLSLYASQRVMLALMEKGLRREKAYDFVQELAFQAKEEGVSLKELLLRDPKVQKWLSPKEIAALFSLEPYFCHLPAIFRRIGWK